MVQEVPVVQDDQQAPVGLYIRDYLLGPCSRQFRTDQLVRQVRKFRELLSVPSNIVLFTSLVFFLAHLFARFSFFTFETAKTAQTWSAAIAKASRSAAMAFFAVLSVFAL